MLNFIGVDNKENDETNPRTSCYRPRSQIVELLRRVSLLIVDEGSMMDRKLFKIAM